MASTILGLSAFLEDTAATVLSGGELQVQVEEERLRRHKHGVLELQGASIASNEAFTTYGRHRARFFPTHAIDACLHGLNGDFETADKIAVGFDPGVHAEQPEILVGKFPFRNSKIPEADSPVYRGFKQRIERLASQSSSTPHFIRHHRAHAYGAAFSSPFSRCNVLTIDGMGELESATLWAFDGQEMGQLLSVPLPHSMGRVYSSVTQYLGYLANRHEQKVMALAGYGEPTFLDKLGKLVRTTEAGFEIEPEYFWTKECGMGFTGPSPLPDVFGAPPRERGQDPMTPPYPDVARSLQEILFEVTSHLVRLAYEQTGYTDLAMSGGVALNCENNGRLLTELDEVTDIHIQPQANDAGVALGAAYVVHHEETGERPQPMEHVFYGPSFPEEEIESWLNQRKLTYHLCGDVAGEVAERVASGEIVGWFQGAMEAGPRALGARSILADPRGAEAANRVNTTVKDRETWRPFAPTVLDEHRNRYLRDDVRDPFMTLALPVTDRARDELEAVVHVTGTTRPQTLRREFHPRYHELVSAFHRETGVPAVLNTSLNVSGEPIVCTPGQAVVDFVTTGMDALALGPFLLEKRGGA